MANSAFSDATHSFNAHNNVSVTSVATNDILIFDGTNWVNSTISHSTIDITQSSHGFSVGEALKSSGSNGAYAKAQADSAANAEVVGVVTVVTDTNNFTLTLSGMITVAGAVPNETAGTALFLSAGTAGALTATEPSTSGQISKPVAIVTTANASMILVTYRGETISTGVTNWDVNGLELVLDADGDTTLHASTDDQIDVKISGADDFRFTANSFNVLSGSTLTIDSGATIANSGTATGFGGSRSVAGTTDNGLITFVNSGSTFAAEANLTYSTDLSITSGNIVIATAGKGIDFSAQTQSTSYTASSEVLDHYEEGAWTPSVRDAAGNTATLDIAIARYTRVGRLVHLQVRVRVQSAGNISSSTETLYIHGLPFNAQNSASDLQSSFAVGLLGGSAVTAGHDAAALIEQNGSKLVLLINDTTTGMSNLQWGQAGSGFHFSCAGFYTV